MFHIQPQQAGAWPPSLQYTFLSRFSAPRGSAVWQRITQAWRQITPCLDAVPPRNAEEIRNVHLWWTSHYIGENFGFPLPRARQLAHRGMHCLDDIYEADSFTLKPWALLQQQFGLVAHERPLVENFHSSIPLPWVDLYQQTETQAVEKDWLGLFPGELCVDPALVFRATDKFSPVLPPGDAVLDLPHETPYFTVGALSRRLVPAVTPVASGSILRGRLRRVRILTAGTSQAKSRQIHHFYLAPLSRLIFDPGRWVWSSGDPLHNYTVPKGRKLLNPRLHLTRTISQKWAGVVEADFTPDWRDVWGSARPRKEAAFAWSLVHRAVAVNHWRHRAIVEVSDLCQCCDLGQPETLEHCFHACAPAMRAWDFVATILHCLAPTPRDAGPWARLSWKQCILNAPLPGTFDALRPLWSLLRGATLWIIWIQRNQLVFHGHRWPTEVLEQTLWDAFLDLARMAWTRIAWCEQNQPSGITKAQDSFNATWLHAGFFFTPTERGPRWNYDRPRTGQYQT
ncbi:hypothetical protein KC19_1G327900 [Ceratodon purpureus]|uniref:Reverse transcriptase zinc-binding domain-containing protein n=1 Tax=Ceratodon purpureus TaxID=3225 RepID=A0A8T0JE89_CERPU|nr:hypothetical protein KC19_1G327900 [Ceratodon purpureus]